MFLKVGIQLLQFLFGPAFFFGLTQHLGDLHIFFQGKAQLQGHKNRFAIVSELQTIVPVGFQAKGKAMLTRAFGGELNGPAKVL